MIKTAQKRFITVSGLMLLAVFLVIFIASAIIVNTTTTRSIAKQLTDIEIVFTDDRTHPAPPHALYAEVTISNKNQVDIKYKNYDSRSFNGTDTDHLIKLISSKVEEVSSGNIDYFYFTFDISDTVTKLYVFDAKVVIANSNSSILASLITFIIIYVLVMVLLYFYSFKVLKPIVENFHRQRIFISDASHELKTPLTIIRANADVLSSQGKNEWVENIKAQTVRMNDLVQDMISLSKLEEGSETLIKENFNLSDEIVNCVLPFEAVTYEKNKRIVYEIQENISLSADRNSIRKLVTILMDNAVKYASEKGKIVVKLIKKKNRIEFSIFNDGSNVPDKDSARIFERFYRADPSRSRDEGGSGLGLAIAKNLANRNKWKIYANSKLGQSMTITVLF